MNAPKPDKAAILNEVVKHVSFFLATFYSILLKIYPRNNKYFGTSTHFRKFAVLLKWTFYAWTRINMRACFWENRTQQFN